MYGSGHTEPLSRDELRAALRRLEAVLARQQQALREAPEAAEGAEGADMLRHTVAMMSEELERLRPLAA